MIYFSAYRSGSQSQSQGDQKWAFRPMSGILKGLLAEKTIVGPGPFFGHFQKLSGPAQKIQNLTIFWTKKWDMSFLFGHKSGHFRRGRCRKKAKYWAFRAFSSEIVVGRMSGIFRQILGIFRANLLVTLTALKRSSMQSSQL